MSTAIAVQPQQNANGIGELMQTAPQPQGLAPTVVPLDRETLAFYGNMIVAANLVPVTSNISQEVAKFRVMAKIVAGVSYGFDPVLSQQCFDIMFNSLQPNARCMEILFKDSGEYDWREVYLNETGCKLKILKRVNGEWDASRSQYVGGTWTELGTVEYTVEMAKKAGLWDKKDSLWPKYPADLSFARCVSRAVKRCNPGCMRPRTLLGNYFAKAPVPVAQETPQLASDVVADFQEKAGAATDPNPTPVADAYIDPPFIDDSEGPEAEFSGMPEDNAVADGGNAIDAPVDRKASKRADYIAAIDEMSATDVAKALDGRKLADLTDGQVKDLYLEVTK